MDNQILKIGSEPETPPTPNTSPNPQTSPLSFLASWKFIAIITALAVLVGGFIWLRYEHKQQSFRKPLLVVSQDQTCKLDTDCIIVATNCSSCECGTSTNKAHQQKYQSQYEKLCKNYRGPIFDCAFDCSTLFPRCINNRCALSAEKSIDGFSTWQTYRNEEFGFELKYPKKYYLEEPIVDKNSVVLLFKTSKEAEVRAARFAIAILDTDKKSVREFSLMNSEFIQIGPYEALMLLDDTPDSSYELAYIIIHDGKEYSFQILPADQEIYFDMDQSLSTFRFVEE